MKLLNQCGTVSRDSLDPLRNALQQHKAQEMRKGLRDRVEAKAFKKSHVQVAVAC